MSNLIFLMCSERSGSNLVARLFDAHPQICGPGTAHLADSILPELYRYAPFDSTRWGQLVSDVHALLQIKNAEWKRQFKESELKACVPPGDVAGLLRFIYLEEARAHGKPVVFVKENRIYEFSGFLAAHFPDARYIYVYRDPRDMAASWKHAYAIRGGVLRAAETWRRDQYGFLLMKAGLEATVLPSESKATIDSYQTSLPSASYEDLVQTPETTLSRLCATVGVDFDPAMLEYHNLSRTHKNAEAVADYGNIARPVFTKSVGSYRDRLDANEICYIENACSELMAALGYRATVDPIGAEALQQLREHLQDLEPYEKARYASVSDEEKMRRQKLSEVRSGIQNRPIPAALGASRSR